MKSILFFAVLATLGLVLIFVGIITKDKINDYNLLLISIGGTFFGTSLGGIISKLNNETVLDAMRKSVESKFKSDEKSIEPFRKKWHYYHITCKNNQFIWQHTEYDFTKVNSPGVLFCEALYTDDENNEVSYNISGGIRQERLIFFVEGKQTKESPAVSIHPFAGKQIQPYHCGVRIHETWQINVNSLSRTIMSKSLIGNWSKIGDVNQATSDKLDEIWSKNIGLTLLKKSGSNFLLDQKLPE